MKGRANSNALEATSTPRVGVIATTTAGRRISARATATFCWLPPDNSATAWRNEAETTLSASVYGLAAASRRDGVTTPVRGGEFVHYGHSDVLGHREMGHKPLCHPVFRHVAGPSFEGQVPAPRSQRPAVYKDAAGGPGLHSRHRPAQGHNARAQQPGDADLFSRRDVQRHTPQIAALGVGMEILDREPLVRVGSPDRHPYRQGGLLLGRYPAHHRPDHFVLRQLRDRCRQDGQAVAQHRHVLADFEHLFQVMRNVKDGEAAGHQLPHALEQPDDGASFQRRGRFVQ